MLIKIFLTNQVPRGSDQFQTSDGVLNASSDCTALDWRGHRQPQKGKGRSEVNIRRFSANFELNRNSERRLPILVYPRISTS